MSLIFTDQIADPVHGTIGLTQVEKKIIGTDAFQRLRNIGQLGLVDYVFPGANYSRLSHCIGVCHVAGQIMEAIRDSKWAAGYEITDAMVQVYRLAGLLHDIGHYPMSHAMEKARKSATLGGPHLNHEEVGELILLEDTEISTILNNYLKRQVEDGNIEVEGEITASHISDIFRRTNPQEEPEQSNPLPITHFTDIISSAIDADRLDYLCRSAHHSGVPYGSINVNYLISQFTMDPETAFVCLTHRAMNAADHFLLGRWFEYQRLIYHPTTHAVDVVLRRVLGALIDHERKHPDFFPDDGPTMQLTRDNVKTMIATGTWADFDDAFVLQKLRKFRDETSEPSLKRMCETVISRKLPKLVYESSSFTSVDDEPPEPGKNVERSIIIAKKLNMKETDVLVDTIEKGIISIERYDPSEGPRETHPKRPIRIRRRIDQKAILLTDKEETLTSLHCDRNRKTTRAFAYFDDNISRKERLDKEKELSRMLDMGTNIS